MDFNKSQGLEKSSIEDIKTPENKIKEGVDFVFEQNPELAQIGSKEQYSEYLDTIFPDSKVKNIVYHGSGKGQKLLPILKLKYRDKIEKFSEKDANNYKKRTGHRGANNVGFYFSPSPEKNLKQNMMFSLIFIGMGLKIMENIFIL